LKRKKQQKDVICLDKYLRCHSSAFPVLKPFSALSRQDVFIALEHPEKCTHQYYQKSYVLSRKVDEILMRNSIHFGPCHPTLFAHFSFLAKNCLQMEKREEEIIENYR
jgi:hypothetical protein